MLTIKYRMTDGAERIEPGFISVITNVGPYSLRPDLPTDHPDAKDHVFRRIVTGFFPDGSTMTFGPVIQPQDIAAEAPTYEPIVYVMNDHGATVGKYSLL